MFGYMVTVIQLNYSTLSVALSVAYTSQGILVAY